MTKNNALPKRKPNRLQGYDYSANGVYFVTICTQNKECVLSRIVGDGVLDVPKMMLSKYGKAVDEQIALMNSMYDNVIVEKYVIMPNHIHLLIRIENKSDSGSSRTVRVSGGHLCIYAEAPTEPTGETVPYKFGYCYICVNIKEIYK